MILDASVSRPTEGGASYPLSHRLTRLGFKIVWALLASWTPPPLHAWRRMLLRAFGAQLASTSGIYASAQIWYPANLKMGERAYIGPGVKVYNVAAITIGDHVSIGPRAQLVTALHPLDDYEARRAGWESAAPIVIGDNVWLAAGVIVCPGVTIGDNTVIGAGSIVTKDVPVGVLAAGKPCRVIRELAD